MHSPPSLRAKPSRSQGVEEPRSQGAEEMSQGAEEGAHNVIFPRRKAGQNKKSGGKSGVVVTYEVLEQCFDMPLHKACKTLGVCATAFKKVCRKLGVMKWPYKDAHMPPKKTKPVGSSKGAKPSAPVPPPPKPVSQAPKAPQAPQASQAPKASGSSSPKISRPTAVRSTHRAPAQAQSPRVPEAGKHGEAGIYRPANRPNRQSAPAPANYTPKPALGAGSLGHNSMATYKTLQRHFPVVPTTSEPQIVEVEYPEPEAEEREAEIRWSDSSEHDSQDSEDFTSCSSPEWDEGVGVQAVQGVPGVPGESLFMPGKDDLNQAALYLDEDRLTLAGGFGVGMYGVGESVMAPEMFGVRDSWQNIDVSMTSSDDLWA